MTCGDQARAEEIVKAVFAEISRDDLDQIGPRAMRARLTIAAHRLATRLAGCESAFRDLSDDQREVIIVARYGRVRVAELSAELRIAPALVKDRMTSGLKRLSQG